MNIFKNLFAASPFAPLQSHMEKVASCVKKLEELYEANMAEDHERVAELAQEISLLEHSADLTKNEIRNNLHSGLFLAVNRGDLLDILSTQDTIADSAEDIGIQMTFKKLKPITAIADDLKTFLLKNTAAVAHSHEIIREMDELVNSSFSGKEAEKVKTMVDEVAYMEHQVDVIQRELLKKLFNLENELHYTDFTLWLQIIRSIASLSNNAENLANRVRMLLDVK